MNKIENAVWGVIANITLKVAKSASGKASMAGTYQAKEPKNFNRVVMRHFKSN